MISKTREEFLRDICLTVKKPSDSAHSSCLAKLGLLDTPKSKSQRNQFPAVFHDRLRGIIKAEIDAMSELINPMDSPAAFTAVMDRVSSTMPIAKPTKQAIYTLKVLVRCLLEERGKPLDTIDPTDQSFA